MITQAGLLNTTALVVPGLYVQIVPPQNLQINGVASDVIGAVGTATWGPVNTPVIIGTMQEYAAAYGPVMARKYDLGTYIMIAVQQGAANFRGVRVTDGTDTAASVTVAGGVFTARYTGTLGNALTLTFATGSAASTQKVTVGLPTLTPEVFDNITGTGATFWTNLAAAITNGNGALRGPSALISMTTNGTTTMPTAGTVAFNTGTLGTDGVTTLTDSVIIGSDAAPRTGMYALRSMGCAIGMLSGINAFTSGSAMAAFGLSESVYMVGSGPSGDTIANAVSSKASAGLDCYALKLFFGDFLYWQDTVNQVQRLVSPTPFAAGRIANLTPNQSSLNKQIYNILGSQKSGLPGSGAASVYAAADLTALFSAGIDVIGNPSPGGTYWGALLGHSTSSNAAISGDNYTRMTNYIATSLNAAMGVFVGQVITPALLGQIRGTLKGFGANLVGQGLLSKTPVGGGKGSISLQLPYQVICDATNNPLSRTALGYVQADMQIQYQGINEKFIVNIEGGASVQISSQS